MRPAPCEESEAAWQPGTNPNGEISRSGNAVLFREDGEVSGFAGTFTVAEKMFLLTPRNVEVSAEEKARLIDKGFFNQS